MPVLILIVWQALVFLSVFVFERRIGWKLVAEMQCVDSFVISRQYKSL